jgi:hypothetical protein
MQILREKNCSEEIPWLFHPLHLQTGHIWDVFRTFGHDRRVESYWCIAVILLEPGLWLAVATLTMQWRMKSVSRTVKATVFRSRLQSIPRNAVSFNLIFWILINNGYWSWNLDCGPNLNTHTTAPDSDCSMPCGGKPTDACGGPNRLSLYHTGSAAIPPPPKVNPGVGQWGYIGCYT